MIRPADHRDLGRVLAMNAAWEHVTSPLDRDDLLRLHGQAAYHRVAIADGELVAFLLALREGVVYASPNYRWFTRAYRRFVYIDRVVVAAAHQRGGWGTALYDDVLEWARACEVPYVVCEVDIEPLNVASAAFHDRHGFEEVGTQWVAGGKKLVSLRCLSLGRWAGVGKDREGGL